MSTIHAESVKAVINRLESEPMNIPKPLIAMMDVVLVMTRTEIAERPARRAATTTEILDFDRKNGTIKMNEVFRWDAKEDKFIFSGKSELLERQRKKLGITSEGLNFELKRRKTVLEWMVKKGIHRYTEVAKVIREYYANPRRVFQKARVGLK